MVWPTGGLCFGLGAAAVGWLLSRDLKKQLTEIEYEDTPRAPRNPALEKQETLVDKANHDMARINGIIVAASGRLASEVTNLKQLTASLSG
jgi:hypothetical protein